MSASQQRGNHAPLVAARLFVPVCCCSRCRSLVPRIDAGLDLRRRSDRHGRVQYDCLNGELRNLVPRQRLSSRDTPWPATQPANEVGTFSLPAIRERMGTGFGHSVVAQRPAPPVYPSPLLLAPPR